MIKPYGLAVKKGVFSGFFFGLSQFILFILVGLLFYLGSLFVRDTTATTEDMFTAVISILYSGMMVGNNAHFMPDVAAAKVSAANLF